MFYVLLFKFFFFSSSRQKRRSFIEFFRNTASAVQRDAIGRPVAAASVSNRTRGFANVYGAHVSVHVRVAREAPAADRTIAGLLLDVHAHVLLQVALEREGLVAQVAHERLEPRVHHTHVRLQVALLLEGAVADQARVRSFARVHARVLVQVALQRKRLAAHVARERPRAGMQREVHLQAGLLREAFLAHQAAERISGACRWTVGGFLVRVPTLAHGGVLLAREILLVDPGKWIGSLAAGLRLYGATRSRRSGSFVTKRTRGKMAAQQAHVTSQVRPGTEQPVAGVALDRADGRFFRPRIFRTLGWISRGLVGELWSLVCGCWQNPIESVSGAKVVIVFFIRSTAETLARETNCLTRGDAWYVVNGWICPKRGLWRRRLGPVPCKMNKIVTAHAWGIFHQYATKLCRSDTQVDRQICATTDLAEKRVNLQIFLITICH